MTAPPITELACPDCGATMRLTTGTYGLYFRCEKYHTTGCKGAHGAHQHGRLMGQPLGTPGDRVTRDARSAAHVAFDALWLDGGPMPRPDAYRWMRKVLRLKRSEAHISKLTRAQCEELIRHVDSYLHRK